ncbi:MAG: hypothetical protein ACTSPC_05835 [Candidatus Heimdallarchaeota archaeon]
MEFDNNKTYDPVRYKKKAYRRPAYNINPEDKGKKYCIKVSESIYSAYLRDKTAVSYSAIAQFNEQRQYGRGQQDEDWYKDYLSSRATSTSAETVALDTDTGADFSVNRASAREGWKNVDWSIFSIMPKIKMALQGNFDGIERDIIATAIDDKSLDEEDRKKWLAWVEKENAQWIREQEIKHGLPQKKQTFIPEDPEELELYKLNGGFKANYTRVMELVTRSIFKGSDWDDLKENLIDDLIDIGIAITKDYYDSETKRVRVRYCDPLATVLQYSRARGFDTSEYGGEIRKVSVSKLISEGFSEEIVKEIAYQYSGYFGNPIQSEWNSYNVRDEHGWKFSNYKVLVFDVCWIDTDASKEAVYITKIGNREKSRKIGFDEKPAKGEKVRSTNLRRLYKCSWIVDTEYAYDYGLEYDVPRELPSEPLIPYKAYRIPTQELTKTLMPLLRNLQVAWLLYQNSIAMSINSGHAIEIGAIQNVGLGGGKNEFLKVIGMWRDTGVLLYKDKTLLGGRGSAGKPIHEMPGSLGRDIEGSIKMFSFNMQLIENITGINPLAIGQTPNPNAPVGTSEMAVAATAKVLRPLLNGVFRIKEKAAKSAMLRIQLGARHNDEMREGYKNIISKRDWEVLKKAEGNNVTYGIHLEARGTEEERIDLKAAAVDALKAGRDGRAGIDMDTYTYILERLANYANLKEIRLYLTSAIRRSKRELAERADQAAILEGQKNQGLEQQKAQDRLEEQELETKGKRILEDQEHFNTMEEIRLKGEIDLKLKQEDAKRAETSTV